MTDFWGIGKRMGLAKQVGEFAPFENLLIAILIFLKGVRYCRFRPLFHANGIDESNVHKPYKPKSHGLGNSQILPRDYERQADIELILREMAEQVAIRLRRAHKKACQVSISIGFSKLEGKRSLQAQMKIEPANNTRGINRTCHCTL